MARVFTTSFQFNGHTYTALVSLINKSLTIRLMDGTFEIVVPRDELASYKSAHDYGEAPNLLTAVLSAVEACSARLQDGSSAGKVEDTP